MKRIILLPLLFVLLVLMCSCTKKDSGSDVTASETPVQSSTGETSVSTDKLSDLKVIKTLTFDDFVNTKEFSFTDIPFGTGSDKVLSSLGISDAEIVAGANGDDLYIDSAVYEFEGIKFYPYIHFWNGGTTLVYLCADSDVYDAETVKSTLFDVFSAELGEPDQNSDTIFWEKANTRLWIGQKIDFPNHGTCSAILIQKVTA